jgi:hypothetical protein
MTMNTEDPAWSKCASPQNQGYFGYDVSPPTNSDNNHYASPTVSPGNWNVVSPSNSSAASPYPASHYSYASPNNSIHDSSNGSIPPTTPSSLSSSSTHDPLELPDQLGIEKSDIEKGREKVAGAKALCLMYETFGGSSNQPTKARPRVRGGLTARQAAAHRYEQESKVKQESKARYKQEKNLLKPAPKQSWHRVLEKARNQPQRKISRRLRISNVSWTSTAKSGQKRKLSPC